MRTDFERGRGCGHQRHFPSRVHLYAVCVRLYGRILRGAVKQTRLARPRRRTQILCDAIYTLRNYHGGADSCFCVLHKAYACVGQRHRAESRRIRGGVHLLPRDIPGHSRPTLLQFHNQHIAQYRRLFHAITVPSHIHDYEHRPRLAFYQSVQMGRCGRGGRNHTHSSALHDSVLRLYVCKIQVFAP